MRSRYILTDLPKTVTITEVCPRDGFQNIAEWIPTGRKLSIIESLLQTGVRHMEVTSFVSPKAIPQMADATDVISRLSQKQDGVDIIALVPNMRGAGNAVDAGVQHVSYVISCSIEHNKANIRRTHEESLNELALIRRTFPNLQITVVMATVFGCPFMGEVPLETTKNLIKAVLDMGVVQITLCDTIGVATPVQVDRVLAVLRGWFPDADFGLHLHNTHGNALANSLIGLQHGISRFETAAGGLGGCPFAPGAAGNCATEDLINMLHRMGIQTGLDLGKYIDVAKKVTELGQSCASSQLSKARPYLEYVFFTQP